jgi:hypothetical protein
MLIRVRSWLALLARSDAAKDVEILMRVVAYHNNRLALPADAPDASHRDAPEVAHVTDGLTAASQRHMGIVCDALTHVAIGVGNIIGVAIRLGHGDIGRSEPKPSIEANASSAPAPRMPRSPPDHRTAPPRRRATRVPRPLQHTARTNRSISTRP